MEQEDGVSGPTAGLELDELSGPFHLKPFYDSQQPELGYLLLFLLQIPLPCCLLPSLLLPFLWASIFPCTDVLAKVPTVCLCLLPPQPQSLTTSDEPGFRCCFWHLTSLLTAIFLQSLHTHYRLFFFLAMHTKPARSLTRSHLWVPSKELANPWFHLLSSSRLPVRCTWGLKCSISIGAAADGEFCAIPEPDSDRGRQQAEPGSL